jgi:hypothetical protein
LPLSLFDFSIPGIDRIRVRSFISSGDPPFRSNHFVNPVSLTSCSTTTFVSRTSKEFIHLRDSGRPGASVGTKSGPLFLSDDLFLRQRSLIFEELCHTSRRQTVGCEILPVLSVAL